MDWDAEIEKLKDYIFVQKLSYEEIGRIYNCTGNNIKKVMKRRGIELPVRSKNAGKEPVNKGTGKVRYCLNCGKVLSNRQIKFCSNICQADYQHKQYINRWKSGEETGLNGEYGISQHIRKYLMDKYSCKCQLCGWGETNPYTHTIPLEIHHIDGNYKNNNEDNLQLLCPNCHSLTETYKSRNKNGRKQRAKYSA